MKPPLHARVLHSTSWREIQTEKGYFARGQSASPTLYACRDVEIERIKPCQSNEKIASALSLSLPPRFRRPTLCAVAKCGGGVFAPSNRPFPLWLLRYRSNRTHKSRRRWRWLAGRAIVLFRVRSKWSVSPRSTYPHCYTSSAGWFVVRTEWHLRDAAESQNRRHTALFALRYRIPSSEIISYSKAVHPDQIG